MRHLHVPDEIDPGRIDHTRDDDPPEHDEVSIDPDADDEYTRSVRQEAVAVWLGEAGYVIDGYNDRLDVRCPAGRVVVRVHLVKSATAQLADIEEQDRHDGAIGTLWLWGHALAPTWYQEDQMVAKFRANPFDHWWRTHMAQHFFRPDGGLTLVAPNEIGLDQYRRHACVSMYPLLLPRIMLAYGVERRLRYPRLCIAAQTLPDGYVTPGEADDDTFAPA